MVNIWRPKSHRNRCCGMVRFQSIAPLSDGLPVGAGNPLWSFVSHAGDLIRIQSFPRRPMAKITDKPIIEDRLARVLLLFGSLRISPAIQNSSFALRCSGAGLRWATITSSILFATTSVTAPKFPVVSAPKPPTANYWRLSALSVTATLPRGLSASHPNFPSDISAFRRRHAPSSSRAISSLETTRHVRYGCFPSTATDGAADAVVIWLAGCLAGCAGCAAGLAAGWPEGAALGS